MMPVADGATDVASPTTNVTVTAAIALAKTADANSATLRTLLLQLQLTAGCWLRKQSHHGVGAQGRGHGSIRSSCRNLWMSKSLESLLNP